VRGTGAVKQISWLRALTSKRRFRRAKVQEHRSGCAEDFGGRKLDVVPISREKGRGEDRNKNAKGEEKRERRIEEARRNDRKNHNQSSPTNY